jgi:hypothetical protein
MPLQGSLSIERMCQLAGVSRAGFYGSLQERAPAEENMEVRSVIQQIAVEHRRRYGYRRISAELRRRGGNGTYTSLHRCPLRFQKQAASAIGPITHRRIETARFAICILE